MQNKTKYEKLKKKALQRKIIKSQRSLNGALKCVYEEIRRDTWCTPHTNCFRGSITIDGKGGESEEHLDKKYQLWKEFRKAGAIVLTEIILKDGSRPDLIVCWNNGEVEIVEIAKSEKEKSLILKEDKYPFPIKIFRI